jgi:hypothetical protein
MEDRQQDFYRRPQGASKEVDTTATTEELAKQQRYTTAIAANVKLIADVDNAELERLGHKLADLATAVQLLRELVGEMDLDALERRLAGISSALRLIADDETTRELGKAG